MARGLVPRGHLGSCHYKRSINCHRERSVAICWQWDCRAVHSARLAMTRTIGKSWTSFFAMTRGLRARSVVRFRVVMARDLVTRGHLGFCHYERSEVIQKQMLLESRLRQSLRFFAMTRVVGKFVCNDKRCGLVRLQ